jgi:general secretion pathway protein I
MRRAACALRAPLAGQASGGFTLIEVLVALAVVAITLATGIKAAGALTGNAERLAAVSAAEWCADNRLVAIRLAHEFPGAGDFDFTCEQLGITYRGRLVVRPTPNPAFRRVDVQLADPLGLPLFSLSTVVPRY